VYALRTLLYHWPNLSEQTAVVPVKHPLTNSSISTMDVHWQRLAALAPHHTLCVQNYTHLERTELTVTRHQLSLYRAQLIFLTVLSERSKQCNSVSITSKAAVATAVALYAIAYVSNLN
jgi:hypothetical protein